MNEKEPFLSRWSRRKLEADPRPALPEAALPTAAVEPPEPAIEPGAQELEQSRGAEYREFFDPQVAEKLRHTALRNLFGDPHFNVMDGLDTYIDDYSIADPIPEAMLRQLNQAKGLLLFEDEKQADERGPAESGGAAASAAAAAGTGALRQAASGSDVAAGVATGAAAAPPAPDIKNS